MATRITTKDLLGKLEQHEAICSVQLSNIKDQLDEGSKRFVRLEQSVWGLYVAIVIVGLFNKFL